MELFIVNPFERKVCEFSQHFYKGLAKRALEDQLSRRDVFQVIAAVSANYKDLAWAPNEIEKAWPKTRNVKSEQLCVKARESGNSKLKQGQLIQALSLYNGMIHLYLKS